MKLVIVYPSKSVYEGDVEYAVVPAEDGDITVMKNTIPFIGKLRPHSKISVYKEQKIINFDVVQGYFYNDKDGCTLCLIPN